MESIGIFTDNENYSLVNLKKLNKNLEIKEHFTGTLRDIITNFPYILKTYSDQSITLSYPLNYDIRSLEIPEKITNPAKIKELCENEIKLISPINKSLDDYVYKYYINDSISLNSLKKIPLKKELLIMILSNESLRKVKIPMQVNRIKIDKIITPNECLSEFLKTGIIIYNNENSYFMNISLNDNLMITRNFYNNTHTKNSLKFNDMLGLSFRYLKNMSPGIFNSGIPIKFLGIDFEQFELIKKIIGKKTKLEKLVWQDFKGNDNEYMALGAAFSGFNLKKTNFIEQPLVPENRMTQYFQNK